MKVIIREADSLTEYLESWKKTMRDTQWFRERRLFDYHPDEIIEDIKLGFENPRNVYLLAKSAQREEPIGVLGVAVKERTGTLGRWEPAVTDKHRETGVAEALLEEAFLQLLDRKVSKARCILKFPFSQPERARWHEKLYQKSGFVLERPPGILLLVDVSKATVKTPKIPDLCVVDGYNFSLGDFADFTQRAYLSAAEDKAVHQSDPYMSNRENVLKMLKVIKTGKMGFSQPEFWRVARLKDRIAGFIIGFIPTKSKYQPTHGLVAELGVFPRFRRKGIAMSLIAQIFKDFRTHGCSYALVGTLKTNNSALKLYNRFGFTPAFEQIDFQKIL